MLNAKEVGGGGMRADVLDPDVYPGRLVQVIDLGMQEQRPFQGEAKDPQYELMLTYEFADEFMKDDDGQDILDKPRWLSETIPFYNLSAERAKSTQRYYALDPTEMHNGDWFNLLGTPCNITVVVFNFKSKDREKVAGISAMSAKKVEKMPDLVNPTKVFDLGNPDLDVFNALPEWVRTKIKGNLEFNGSVLAGMLDGTEPTKEQVEANVPADDDEIPF